MVYISPQWIIARKRQSKLGDALLCSEQAPQSQERRDCHALRARNDNSWRTDV